MTTSRIPSKTVSAAADQAEAHNRFSDALIADQVRHDALPALGVAVRNAAWKPSGDTRVLDRRGAADVSPLIAVALAAHGLATSSRAAPRILNLAVIMQRLGT